MRANITYSVDTDSIPEEVARLIMSESDSLSDNLHEIEHALATRNFTEARNKIMSSRQALGNADIRLYELDQILAGYIEIINRTPPEDEAGEESEEDLHEQLETNESG